MNQIIGWVGLFPNFLPFTVFICTASKLLYTGDAVLNRQHRTELVRIRVVQVCDKKVVQIKFCFIMTVKKGRF
jgi:hypothetical protein